MKKQLFIAVFGGVVFLGSISSAFAQQSSQKGASASFSFSGSGDGPIEVRGANGEIQEVLRPSQMRLNRPSAQAVERERAYHKKKQEQAQAYRERRAEERRAAAEQTATVEKLAAEQRIAAEERAAHIAAGQAEKPLNPYRVRRRTIRRKIVETETVDN